MTPEEFIKDYMNGCSNELSAVKYTDGREVIEYHEWVTPDQALCAVELAREQMINWACDWLTDTCNQRGIYPTERVVLVENFRKAMKDYYESNS